MIKQKMEIRACLLIFATGRSVPGNVSIRDSLRWCSWGWWAGLLRGWGILGVRVACSGMGGGGPGWRGHYNAVNTFKFWMLKKTKTKMFKTESSARTRLVFRGLLLVVVAAGEFHWHFTCGFNFRYGLRKLFDQSQRG